MRLLSHVCLIAAAVLASGAAEAGPAGGGPGGPGGPVGGGPRFSAPWPPPAPPSTPSPRRPPATAVAGMSLGEVLFGAHGDTPRASLPAVARYTPDGGQNFIFDRTASPPLMRFEDSVEIWVLQPQPGPRGDVIYRNDVGEPMLRATRLGGLTLFTPDHPNGAAAALDGEAAALHPMAITSPGALLQHLAQASARASHAVQRLVVFDAPDVTAESAPLVADAATIAAEAIGDIARRSGLQPHGLSRLSRVQLIPGRRPSAAMADNVLKIVISPQQGVAGRPSSRRVAAALTR
jgi:hypothetical protein